MRFDLRTRLFLSFASLIVAISIVGAAVGVYQINLTVVEEAQHRIRQDLRAAWAAYQDTYEDIRDVLELLSDSGEVRRQLAARNRTALSAALEQVRLDYGWDYLTITDAAGVVVARSRYPYLAGDDRGRDPLVRRALRGEVVAATQLRSPGLLQLEGEGLSSRAFMVFEPTPRAKRRSETEETSAMVLESAVPVQNQQGDVIGVIYGGVLLNRWYELVDQVKDTVFKGEQHGGKDLGTVTIFQWDLRIATNVMKANGNRAIGTRVSEEVYDRVLENGLSWQDRAFVVNDWYITAYDPIQDIDGAIIGILYVGVLESKYDDMRNQVVKSYLGITFIGVVLVLLTSFFLARHLVEPIWRLREGARALTDGDLDHRIATSRQDEIGDLNRAFNSMADSLRSRETDLRRSNAELTRVNRNYMDMLGFVSHELKNSMGSCLTHALSLRDGFLGSVTDRQRAALESVTRGLEGFEEMVRHYLDLSRIEKGELTVDRKPTGFLADLLDVVLLDYPDISARLQVDVSPVDICVEVDPDLIRIVLGNLIGNAVKYGRDDGAIRCSARLADGMLEVSVWNEGEGMPADQTDRLFRKFSRLNGVGAGKKGTGLGLFIAKEIVEKHGGRIWANSKAGEWADFRFTLPALQAGGQDVDRAESAEELTTHFD